METVSLHINHACVSCSDKLTIKDIQTEKLRGVISITFIQNNLFFQQENIQKFENFIRRSISFHVIVLFYVC